MISINHDTGTLVVVDMQRGFTAGCHTPGFVKAAAEEIRRAKRRGWGIVVLELLPSVRGGTLKTILKAIGAYPHVAVVPKDDQDGSREVIEACRKCGFSSEHYRMVGVYIDACIEGTAFGLLDQLPNASVTAVRKACSSNTMDGAWENFRGRDRLQVA